MGANPYGSNAHEDSYGQLSALHVIGTLAYNPVLVDNIDIAADLASIPKELWPQTLETFASKFFLSSIAS